MLERDLVAYIFHQLNGRSKVVSKIEVERNENYWQHNELYLLGPKKK